MTIFFLIQTEYINKFLEIITKKTGMWLLKTRFLSKVRDFCSMFSDLLQTFVALLTFFKAWILIILCHIE